MLMAQNLARNLGWAVFPCHDGKAPARPKRDGGNGFQDASCNAAEIADLWQRWPGPLIGLATGAVSGVDALDLDLKHDDACAWWAANVHRFPKTRTYRTRGGGFHSYFRHYDALKSSAGWMDGAKRPGIDCRADGGYIVFWYSAGFEALSDEPIAAWPDWLITALQKPAYVPPSNDKVAGFRAAGDDDRGINGVLRTVEQAAKGNRNQILYWAGARFGERISAGSMTTADAKATLVQAGIKAGLTKLEAERTVQSDLGRSPR